jgi:hypothetical protein
VADPAAAKPAAGRKPPTVREAVTPEKAGEDIAKQTAKEVTDDSGDGDTVIAVQPICSFLHVQLSDEELKESSLPLVVHNPSFASSDGEAKVPDSVHAVTGALLKNRLCQ